ncbi:unnamed protein product [Clavelina lepadiformis]|uniref:BRCT domain-containing protein n=1 Tax=Clavelina lepadiformis TaxID=159417 RepID=A0ABP0GAS2_CLALP
MTPRTIRPVSSEPYKRWNFRKAYWELYRLTTSELALGCGCVDDISLDHFPLSIPFLLKVDVIDEVIKNIVKELGGHIAEDMYDCTHLVTNEIRRNVKFLCAIVRGLHIVNQQWLYDSKKQSRFLAELSYESFNESSTQSIEARYGLTFTNTMAVARSRSKQLFSGHWIHVTKSVLPPPQEMYQIIECGGGVCVWKMPKGLDLHDLVIVASEVDKKCCSSALKASVPVNREFILTGILKQKLDFRSCSGASS